MKRTSVPIPRFVPLFLATVLALVIATMVGPSQAATYAYSAPASFRADTVASFRADTVANTYAVFSWKSPSSAVDSFSFRYSLSSSMSSPNYRVPSAAILQINDLKPNTRYYAQVRARKSGKDVSEWSSTLSFRTTTTAFPPPSAPSFPADRIRNNSFKMQWGEVPNASRYRIELTGGNLDKAYYFYTHSNENSFYIGRGGDAEDSDGNRVYDENGQPIAGFPTLQANKRYTARVRALEAKKDSGVVYELTGYSSSRSVSTNSWRVYPPQEFTAESTTSDGITLSWQDVKAQAQAQNVVADSYRIQYWLNGSSTRNYVNTGKLGGQSSCGSLSGDAPGSGGTVRITLKRLCNLDGANSSVGNAFTAGKTYRFRVSALTGGAAVSDYTASAGLASLASNQSLPTPDDFRVDRITDTSMTLSWTAVPGATSYRLQQKRSSTSGSTRYLYDICEIGGQSPQVTCTTDGDRRSVTLTRWDDNNTGANTGFKSNEVYYIRIAAQKGTDSNVPSLQARASDYSTSYLKAQLKGWPYDPPEDVTVKTNDSTSITLQWKAVNDPDGDSVFDPKHPKVRYRIQYSTTQTMGSPKYATTTTVNSTSLRIAGLANKKIYYFRIRAVDENNSGMLSDYTEIGKPWTGSTLGKVGKVNGTLTVEAGCSPSDYELATYWGDEVEKTTQPTVSGQTAKFEATGLLIGSAYNFRYEYNGSNNCVSPWVSGATDKLAESHMLKSSATKYPLAEGERRQLPITTAFTGVTVAGKVTAGQDGPANPDAWVTAYGGPRNGASSYREVHDISISDRAGHYQLSGLWPDGKYKFYVSGGSSGMTSGESTYTLWKDHVSTSSPGTTFNIWLCNGVGGACVPGSNVTGSSESSGGSYPGGYGYPVPSHLQRDGTAQTTSLKLTWDAVPGAPMYRVQYSTSATMSGAKYAGFHGTTGTLTGLTAGKKYFVRIAVVKEAAGIGGAKMSDYTPTPYPAFSTLSYGGFAYQIPGGLTSTGRESTSLTLDWGDVTGAPFYRVQYSTSSSMSGAKYAGFNASTGTLTGLTPNTKYYFRVAVVEASSNPVGGGKLSDYTQETYPWQNTLAP